MTSLRILLADDHAAVRRSIRALLSAQPGWEVCAEVSTGREAVDEARRLQPDIVLLDITMPELNGFAAARQILLAVPRVCVLLLTTHQSDELTDEARRAGAAGMILKSDAHTIIATIHSLGGRARVIHLAGGELTGRRHVAAFFGSDGERYGVLNPFITEGLARGEKAFHVISRADQYAHVRRLLGAGVDVERATVEGQMEVVGCETIHPRGSPFDGPTTVSRIETLLQNNARQGFPLTRFVAHMEWALASPSIIAGLASFEAALDSALLAFPDVVICAYDLSRFDGGVIIDVLRVHPVVVIGGSLYENPFFVS